MSVLPEKSVQYITHKMLDGVEIIKIKSYQMQFHILKLTLLLLQTNGWEHTNIHTLQSKSIKTMIVFFIVFALYCSTLDLD